LQRNSAYRRRPGRRAWEYALSVRSDALRTSSVSLGSSSSFVSQAHGADDFSAAQYVSPRPGAIVDLTTGRTIGQHTGLWNFTIGENARVPGMPQRMFVARNDVERNEVLVVPGTCVFTVSLLDRLALMFISVQGPSCTVCE
jgi:hypothetical protein